VTSQQTTQQSESAKGRKNKTREQKVADEFHGALIISSRSTPM
jgi:hypothetical protein